MSINTERVISHSGKKGFKFSMFAGGLSLGLGIAYLYYQRSNNYNPALELSKETVLKILKEFRREFYVVFKNLTIASQKIQSEYRSRYNIPAEEMKELLQMHLINENPTFKPQIQDIEDKIYSKFDVINRVEFEKLCGRLAKNDYEIRNLMEEIKELFKQAIMGISRTPSIVLPSEFSSEITALVYKNSIKEVLRRVLAYVRAYTEENGAIGLADEKFHMGLQSLSLDQIKNKVLSDSGLPLPEDFHPQQVFAFAIGKYSKEDSKFNERVSKLEKFNQEYMQKMFIPGTNFDNLSDELEKIEEAFLIKEAIIELADNHMLLNQKEKSPFDEEEVENIIIEAEPLKKLEEEELKESKNTESEIKITIEKEIDENENKDKRVNKEFDENVNNENLLLKDEPVPNRKASSAMVEEITISHTSEKGFFDEMEDDQILNQGNNLLDISDN